MGFDKIVILKDGRTVVLYSYNEDEGTIHYHEKLDGSFDCEVDTVSETSITNVLQVFFDRTYHE